MNEVLKKEQFYINYCFLVRMFTCIIIPYTTKRDMKH